MKNIRWYLFWLKDFFEGSTVRKMYNDIKNNDEKKNEEKLKKLLKHAVTTTSYYSKYNSDSIFNFPIINKNIIKENYEKLKSNKYEPKDVRTMSTSGSTGIPLTVIQDKNKRKKCRADFIYFWRKAGYTFGEKQIFFRIWTKKNLKRKIDRYLQNVIAYDISNIDEKNLESVVELLKKDKKIKNIFSYASTLKQLSEYMIKNNCKPDEFSITSIISTSEMLEEATRENLKKIFNCNVISSYGNQENGLLAQENIEKGGFELNTNSYFFEFLKLDQDVPAEEGEISRIIVTDLYNYAMPIIRYDTGDIAIYRKVNSNVKNINQLYGRKVDSIKNTKGEVMSPHVITNNMWGIENVKQFKFQQVGLKEYKMILNMNDNYKVDEEKINFKFKNLLGEDANFAIEYVSEIPVLSSGKRKYIENLYGK